MAFSICVSTTRRMPAANSSTLASGPFCSRMICSVALPIEPHSSAQKAVLVQPPKQKVRIGNGGHGSAAKTDRPRLRSRRLRSHAQHAAGIEAGNRSASGPGGMNVQHGHAYRHAGHHRFARQLRAPGGRIGQENIGRCAAHIEADDALEAGPAGHLAGADHSARRPRQHRAHRLRRRAPRRDDAARGLHHVHAAAGVVAGHALLQMQQIALHPGREIRIDHGGRCPLILAKLGQNAVRGGDG